MDRRLHLRQVADIDIRVTDLNAELSHCGRVADVSRAGLCAILDGSIPLGTPLRLEAADSVLFGFVVHVTPQESNFRTGIELQQVLVGGTDLSRLLENCLRAVLPSFRALRRQKCFWDSPPNQLF